MNPDRELLTGVLAHELGFVTRDALVEAAKAWIDQPEGPLLAILVERGALPPQRQTLLEALAAAQIELHEGDASLHRAEARATRGSHDDPISVADGITPAVHRVAGRADREEVRVG